MKASHVHLGVKDLGAALEWLDRVWTLRPSYQNERMATLPFGDVRIVLDASGTDTAATLAFESTNCDEDFRRVVSRGAVSTDEPADRAWGVRSGVVRGPGALKFEIEQPLSRPGR